MLVETKTPNKPVTLQCTANHMLGQKVHIYVKATRILLDRLSVILLSLALTLQITCWTKQLLMLDFKLLYKPPHRKLILKDFSIH